jgi:hypothetical protein
MPTRKEDDQAKPSAEPSVLDQYPSQARELEEALGKVKAIREQTAAITQARDAAASKRQSLLSNWTDTEEESVTELSKLAARAEVFQAKLAAQNGKLESAEAELKAAMATFAISFNALFLTLRTHLVRDAADRIAGMLHPSVRQIAGASVAEVAQMDEAVVNIAAFAINPEPGIAGFDSVLPPENIIRAAEQSLPKAEPLLDQAAKHLENGFAPPQAFSLEKWRESLSPVVAAAA